MGALHEGHLSLVDRSLKENDITAVSIFVNPTQFNDKTDFQTYPRNLRDDLDLLEKYEVDLVFAPSAGEMYPEPDTRDFDFGGLDLRMEGKHRPGHFRGVAQIVSKLFTIIGPDVAYFGEKDFQQLAIIRKMTRDLKLPVRIQACPIVREKDGLAMSSRNRLLSPDERKAAARIPAALMQARGKAGRMPVEELIRRTIEYLSRDPLLKVDYFELVDEKRLQPVSGWDEPAPIRACIAVKVGQVRLIDNMDFSL